MILCVELIRVYLYGFGDGGPMSVASTLCYNVDAMLHCRLYTMLHCQRYDMLSPLRYAVAVLLCYTVADPLLSILYATLSPLS